MKVLVNCAKLVKNIYITLLINLKRWALCKHKNIKIMQVNT